VSIVRFPDDGTIVGLVRRVVALVSIVVLVHVAGGVVVFFLVRALTAGGTIVGLVRCVIASITSSWSSAAALLAAPS
jgi:hypothetical protein